MKNISKEEYQQMTAEKSENSPVIKDCLLAFITGGAICAAGQAIFNFYSMIYTDEKLIRTAVSISLIFISAVLTGFGIYDKIAKFGGAGTLVPITGFANSVVAAALDFKAEGFITGLGVKMFIIAGPVIVYGVSVSVVYGLILYLISLF